MAFRVGPGGHAGLEDLVIHGLAVLLVSGRLTVLTNDVGQIHGNKVLLLVVHGVRSFAGGQTDNGADVADLNAKAAVSERLIDQAAASGHCGVIGALCKSETLLRFPGFLGLGDDKALFLTAGLILGEIDAQFAGVTEKDTDVIETHGICDGDIGFTNIDAALIGLRLGRGIKISCQAIHSFSSLNFIQILRGDFPFYFLFTADFRKSGHRI